MSGWDHYLVVIRRVEEVRRIQQTGIFFKKVGRVETRRGDGEREVSLTDLGDSCAQE